MKQYAWKIPQHIIGTDGSYIVGYGKDVCDARLRLWLQNSGPIRISDKIVEVAFNSRPEDSRPCV
jgi:hypothetical protein